jgi:hypothetical protein
LELEFAVKKQSTNVVYVGEEFIKYESDMNQHLAPRGAVFQRATIKVKT